MEEAWSANLRKHQIDIFITSFSLPLLFTLTVCGNRPYLHVTCM